MAPFYILLLVPIILQHSKIKGINYQKKNIGALTFFFVVLTLLVMLRHQSTGSDTEVYTYHFKRYALMSWSELSESSVEVGYQYLNKIISWISMEPQFFLSVVAIAVSVMVYPTYRRLCNDSSLTIVLFCTMSTFVMMFSGIKQMIAIGIGFIAYEFVRNKKLIPFILAVGIAMTFHASAFMLAFMYPLYHVRITKKWLYWVVPALLLIFIFNVPIFSSLTAIIERYTEYSGAISSTGAYAMLILFVLFVAFSFLVPDEKLMDAETIGLRNFLLFSLVIQMFAPLHTLAMRMNYYYIIFIPLLLPKIIECKSERWKQVAVLGRHVMVVFFLAYFFYNAYTGTSNLRVFPYHFFWENLS